MTPSYMQASFDPSSAEVGRDDTIPSSAAHMSAMTQGVSQSTSSLALKHSVFVSSVGIASRMSVKKVVVLASIKPERLGATIDPFLTLPMELRSVSDQSVFHFRRFITDLTA